MSAITLSEQERHRLRRAHPEVFHRRPWQRWGGLLLVAGALGYLIYCWSFFDIGTKLGQGKWERAGIYMADWVSWEAQPRFRFQPDGSIAIEHQRFSPLGENPDPDWMTVLPDGRKQVTFGSADDRIEIATTDVVAVLDGVAYDIVFDGDAAVLPEDAPATMTEKNGRVTVSFGFAGSAEIRSTQVLVRRRFLGWENFWFDTTSPFWGMGLPAVWSSVTSSERIDPAQSNLSLAWNEFLTNSEWQHGDVFNKLAQTIVMAFVGTLFAALLAFPLAFIAARNVTNSKPANWMTKRLFDFTRSVDMLIWALVFTRGFGPGPLAGIAAIFVTDTGTFGKLYSEAIENIDDKQREGIRSVGASTVEVNRFGIVPQIAPVVISQTLYFWEANIRGATIIGAVGAGGIGLKLLEAMRTNQDWENVAYMVLLILCVVFVFDTISSALRSRLIGKSH
ncbi:phosphonate ABC transporter permease [Devosia limi DSM 17137]|uniref:Phosphonate ABC transporter permease n=1 Tax=Devosia limi DSM 17137 TaxID=1121477 RepID=A0A0F5LPX0_9HYPH|nr:phosphonate ABC transporter, permease protein PhnE [Devosia limi]KKB84149.1 phosphonate ABC transporter permease [Devosia limi DSM 17137]SHE93816.1 phosphonate transport system permease protein [Devosia limi DSM 17137]